ncbi:hypothetical protein RISK_004808 [Rhodopirellula islandica]|uniref:Uncharacterized protein n=1 Tax=Rhodopirellula islandica TaxID=595434 RepID=A0A0J1EC20_RHOIS|nr:hypothetical protein RISK_004808 [Rhodopirellula islandica]
MRCHSKDRQLRNHKLVRKRIRIRKLAHKLVRSKRRSHAS